LKNLLNIRQGYFFILLIMWAYGASLSSAQFSVRLSDDITGQADIFPDTPIGFMAKFKRDSVLFQVESQALAKGIEIDSSFQFVVIYERLFGDDVKKTRVVKLLDFLDARTRYEDRVMWFKSVEKNLGVAYTSTAGSGDIVLDIPFKIKSKTFHRVFGGDNIGLRVRGSLSISVIGQQSYTDMPNAENESFDFTLNQTQNISIRGKVGSKVDVDIAQNTESFDFENSLKITYTGDSDEIIQKLEAGNIGLSLPGTRFVSFSGVNKGLFGLKTETKIGKLKTTSIASFEKGKKNQIQAPNGVRKNTRDINAKDYLRNKYFFLDTLFRANMGSAENFTRLKEHRPLLSPPYKIKANSFQIYSVKTEIGVQTQADIYIDHRNKDVQTIGNETNLLYPNSFVKLIPEEFYEVDNLLGYIRLKSYLLSSGEKLAVRFVLENISNPNDVDSIGSGIEGQAKLELQLLAEEGQEPSDPWSYLEWKNVYSLQGVDISREGFKLTIQRNTPTGLKSEEYDKNNVARPYLYWYEVSKTDVIDEVDINFLNSASGEFIFPALMPFMPDPANSIIYREGSADSLFVDPAIYTDYSYNGSEYNLRFEFSSKSSSYDLGFNVIEGSEVVRSGATTLKKDVDYVINYNTGQLTVINERFISADIEILYESASIFQLDQKLLIGNRFEYNFSKDTYLGATVLYLSESTTKERVHVGYEPKKNLVLDINGQTNVGLPFLTTGLDWLPFASTDKESKMYLEGEIAQIIPDPNPLGLAYIDDFESSKIKKSLGISYGSWSMASYPDFYGLTGLYSLIGGAEFLAIPVQYFLQAYSGKSELSFYWYNPKDENKLTKEEIYPDTPGDQKNDKVTSLNIVFKPSYRSEAIAGNVFDPKDSWGGIMKYLHSSYQDFRDVKYIEMLLNTNKTVTLNIDIGDLSEDVIPNKKTDTEDNINRNNVLDIDGDISEDRGIDGIAGSGGFYALDTYDPNNPREKEPYEFYSFDSHPAENGKPVPDSQLKNYWDFIKTEGNGRLDSEDLDGGGNLDTSIRAYRYTITLKPSPTFGDKYVVSTDYNNGFALYRIPVEEFTSILNREPDLSKMKYMKIWVNNSADTLFSTRVNFVSLDLVGNEWAAKGDNKGKIEAKTINNQDDKERYHSPPGVKELDDNGYEKPEQSLSLNIKLDPLYDASEYGNGWQAFLTKTIRNGENYLQYGQIKMFLHGGTKKEDPLWDADRPLYYIYRFGTDSLNYYEYRSKLVNGWQRDGISNQMIIDLDELTTLKTSRSDGGFRTDSIYLEPYKNDLIKRYIGIRGNPTLQSVKYFNAGVLDSLYTPLQTEIWMNELRLTKVMKDPGTAMRAKVRIEAADIATLDAEAMNQDENFHRIEDSRGTGVNQTSLSVNTSLNMDKLLPKQLGLSLPLRYSYNNSNSYSKYQGTTDILVDKNAIPDSVKTETTRNQYDFSIKKVTKSANPFMAYTLDIMNLTGNISFNETSNASYIYQKSSNYSYSSSYALVIPESWFSFTPFIWGKNVFFFKTFSDAKFVILPSSYNFSINTAQSETVSLTRRNSYTENRTFTLGRNFSTSLTPLPFVKSDYTLRLNSDMYKEAVERDTSTTDTVVTRYNRNIGDIFTGEFGELTNLESTLKNNFKLSPPRYLTNDLSVNTTYSWSGNLGGRTPAANMKNSINGKLNSKLKVKEAIGDLQAGMSKLFPDKPKVSAEANKTDSVKTAVKDTEEKRETSSRFSRTASAPAGKKKSVLEFLKENLADVNLSFAQGRDNSFSDMKSLDQADPAFFFGFSDTPKDLEYTSSSWNGNWSFTSGTKLGLSKNFSIDGISYSFSRSYRQNNNEGFAGSDNETGFVWPWVQDAEHKKTGAQNLYIPNYSINISGLQDLLQAKEMISSISISHSKSGTSSNVWYVDGAAPDMYLTGIPDLSGSDLKVKSENYSTGFSPLAGIRISLKNGLSFNASYNYTYDHKETYQFAAEERKVQTGEKKYTRELRLSGSYSQKGGFSMPFNFWPFKGAKLDNDISYNLMLSYSSNSRHNYNAELNEFESLEKGILSDNFTLSPDITYKISKRLNGTASYSYNYNETKNFDARSIVNTNHKFELRAVLSISGN
jgi:hypothetical protein